MCTQCNTCNSCNPCACTNTTNNQDHNPVLLDCNTLTATMESLKKNFEKCKTLSADDMDRLVDVIYSVQQCPSINADPLNNLVVDYDLPAVNTEAEVHSQINLLDQFTIDGTQIAFFNVTVGGTPSKYVLKIGKGSFGDGGTTLLNAEDIYLVSKEFSDQDNKYKVINFGSTSSPTDAPVDVSAVINSLQTAVTVAEDEIPMFIGYVSKGRAGSNFNKYVVTGYGKGTYGTGGDITLVEADLELISTEKVGGTFEPSLGPNALVHNLGEIGTEDFAGYINGDVTGVNLSSTSVDHYIEYQNGGLRRLYRYDGANAVFNSGNPTFDANDTFLIYKEENIPDVIDPTGLEAIDEGNGTAWRLVGQDPANRVNAGNSSVDGMIYSAASDGAADSPTGPMGINSIGGVSFGVNNKDTGSYYNIAIGAFNETTDFALTSMIGGYNKSTGGYGNFLAGAYNTITTSNFNSFSFAIGMNNLVDAGINPGGALGTALTVKSRNHVAVGISNTEWTGGDSADRPIFTVGIGTSTTPAGRWAPSVQKDGFNVHYDGKVIADSLTTALIDAEPTGKVLVTKEYVENNVKPYKVFTAHLTHNGAADPTVVILENTLGVTPVITRTGTGIYSVTAAIDGTTKTVVLPLQGNGLTNEIRHDSFSSTPTIAFNIKTWNSGALSDLILNNTMLEFRIYN